MQAVTFHICLLLIGTISFFMNSVIVVLLVTYRQKLLGVEQNKLLLSLALSGLWVAVSTGITGTLLYMDTNVTLYKLFGMLPLYGSIYASIFNITLLTIERYISVKYPLRYVSIITHQRRLCAIVFSWVMPLIMIALHVLVLFLTDVERELKVRGVTFFLVFCVSAVILSMLNISVHRVLRKQYRSIQQRISVVTYSSQNIGGLPLHVQQPERKNAKSESEARNSSMRVIENLDEAYNFATGKQQKPNQQSIYRRNQDHCIGSQEMGNGKSCFTDASNAGICIVQDSGGKEIAENINKSSNSQPYQTSNSRANSGKSKNVVHCTQQNKVVPERYPNTRNIGIEKEPEQAASLPNRRNSTKKRCWERPVRYSKDKRSSKKSSNPRLNHQLNQIKRSSLCIWIVATFIIGLLPLAI